MVLAPRGGLGSCLSVVCGPTGGHQWSSYGQKWQIGDIFLRLADVVSFAYLPLSFGICVANSRMHLMRVLDGPPRTHRWCGGPAGMTLTHREKFRCASESTPRRLCVLGCMPWSVLTPQNPPHTHWSLRCTWVRTPHTHLGVCEPTQTHRAQRSAAA